MTLSTSKLGAALVGAGSVGTAVASLLRDGGHSITGVSSRSETSAMNAATRLGSTTFDPGRGLPPGTDLVLVGVPDALIGEVAMSLASRSLEGTVVVHFAGSWGIGPLAPVVQAGGKAAALHPVQACPDIDTAIRRLPGCAWGVTCLDTVTHDLITTLITRDLQGSPVTVAEEDRAAWHAAAVTTSNGIAALMAAGEAILAAIGIDEPHRVLGPISSGTVSNAVEGSGGAATLTGPMVRGEDGTVRRHVQALAERAPNLLPLYRAAARLIAESAHASGRISTSDRDSIIEIVDET